MTLFIIVIIIFFFLILCGRSANFEFAVINIMTNPWQINVVINIWVSTKGFPLLILFNNLSHQYFVYTAFSLLTKDIELHDLLEVIYVPCLSFC